jgi:hypothetical protein
MDQFIACKPRGRRLWWVYALSVSVITVYALFMGLSAGRVGPADFDQFVVFHELQYWNNSLFGLAKQWSPVMCAGLSIAGEPQVPFMSLTMAISYWLGPLLGIELGTLIYFVLGWIGAYLYAGLWLPHKAQRALASSLFVGNGFFFCRYSFGHIDFIPFLSLPLMLWTLHHSIRCWRDQSGATRAWSLSMLTMGLAALTSVVIDGSPVAMLHLLFWVGLYCLALTSEERCGAPVALFVLAATLAALLDAGYLWPMLESQALFPRRTPDGLTNPFALLWFMLLPGRGKLIGPATGNGHELSVFIGPIVGYLLWRYRRRFMASVPSSMLMPLGVVSLVSIWMGMGSLRSLHVPTYLSLFDWLRPLPGFRSMGVTGRYWGFLALPLSLGAAAAIWRLLATGRNRVRVPVLMSCALIFQCGFQAETIWSQWMPGSVYAEPAFDHVFHGRAETVTYVRCAGKLQGALISPIRTVTDCYDQDDFIRADVAPGSKLVKSAEIRSAGSTVPLPLRGEFQSWNHMRFGLPADPLPGSVAPDARVRIVLNQAYHPLWRSEACTVSRHLQGNLVLDCPFALLDAGSINLSYRDVISDAGARASLVAWRVWLSVMVILLMMAIWRCLPTGERVAVQTALEVDREGALALGHEGVAQPIGVGAPARKNPR